MLGNVLQYLGGLSFEGGLSAFLSMLITAVVAGIVKGWREARKKDAAVQRAYESTRPTGGKAVEPDDRPTRQLPEVAPDDATVDSLRALLKRVQRDNEALRESLREATRANDVECQALRRELATVKRERGEAESKLAAQFYDLRKLQSQVEVLAAEVNGKRRDEEAGLSTPRSSPPGIATLPPKAR
jgi:hypothetical protein